MSVNTGGPKYEWRDGYLVVPYSRPIPGMQSARYSQPMRAATCAEVKCSWYLEGKTGDDDGKPFVHPHGVECGNFSGCQPCASPIEENGQKTLCGVCIPCKRGTSNCPCLTRKVQHKTPLRLISVPPKFRIADSEHSSVVPVEEWIDRLAEGLDMRERIKTRGL